MDGFSETCPGHEIGNKTVGAQPEQHMEKLWVRDSEDLTASVAWQNYNDEQNYRVFLMYFLFQGSHVFIQVMY